MEQVVEVANTVRNAPCHVTRLNARCRFTPQGRGRGRGRGANRERGVCGVTGDGYKGGGRDPGGVSGGGWGCDTS